MNRGLWNSLEGTGVPSRLAVDWQRRVGPELATLGPFLRPSDEVALTYPCLNEMDCGCRHELIQFAEGRWLARCTCDEFGPCPAPRLTAQDLVMHELDATRFGATVAQTLGFDLAPRIGPVRPASAMWSVGRHAETGAPVVLSFCGREELWLKELLAAVESLGEPFILLSPTGRAPSEAVISLVKRERCAVVPLAKSLALDGPGRFRLVTSIAPVLERFKANRVAQHTIVPVLEGIRQEIAAVRDDRRNLSAAKARLEKMHGEGMFAFASHIDREAREQFMAIMACGDVAKAARELTLKDTTLRSKLEKWPKRGKAYATLAEIVRWRKSIKGEAGMAEARRVASGAEREVDFPALIRDVVEELEMLAPENWEEKCEALAAVLRKAVG